MTDGLRVRFLRSLPRAMRGRILRFRLRKARANMNGASPREGPWVFFYGLRRSSAEPSRSASPCSLRPIRSQRKRNDGGSCSRRFRGFTERVGTLKAYHWLKNHSGLPK